MSSLGSLVVTLAANSAAFISDLTNAAGAAEKSFGKIEASGERMGLALGRTIAKIVGVGGLPTMVQLSINAADEMLRMSQAMGISVESLSTLSHQAKLADVDMTTLATAVGRLNRNVEEASHGTGDAARAFKALGISVTDSGGNLKNADQIMGEVADKFAVMEDGAGKAALGSMIFGKGFAPLIPLLNEGAAGLEKAKEESIAFGLVLSGDTARAADQFNDNITRLKAITEGFATHLMRELVPALNLLIDPLIESAKHTSALGDSAAKTSDAIKQIAGVFIQFVTGLEIVRKSLAALELAWAEMAKNAFSFKDLMNPAAAFERMKEAAARAGKILENAGNDAKAAWAGATQQVQTLNSTLSTIAKGGAMDMGVGTDFLSKANKSKAPTVAGAGDAKAAADAQKKAYEEGIFFAKQWIEQMEEEAKVSAEIAQLLTDYRIKDVEEEKKRYEERTKAMVEFYQREQEMAIEQGEALAEGKSHSLELMALEESLKSRETLEWEAHAAKLERLQQFSDEELELLGGRQALIERMQAEHEDRMVQLTGRHTSLSLGAFKTFFGHLSTLMSSKHKEMFNIGKAAAIAQTIINTAEAAMAAYKSLAGIPIVGPAMGIAAAAAATLYGVGQIAAIRSTSFGGGGAAAAIPVAAASPITGQPIGTPGGDVGPQQTTVVRVFKIEGVSDESLLTGKQFRRLLEQFAEEMPSGGRVVVG